MTTLAPTTESPGRPTYGMVAKLLHWLIVALVVLQFGLGWTMPDLPRGRPPEGLVSLHLSIGATILAVMLARLVWRLVHGAPPPLVAAAWQRRLASVMHLSLYALLIVVPLAGWSWASAKGWTVSLLGMVELPALVPPGWPYRPLAASLHRNGAWAILGLVALHALAALQHHVVQRDDVLRRMLPGGSAHGR